MPDAATLAGWGGAALGAVWLPVAVWTALALAVEGALRVGRAEAAVGLPVRGAALAALPLSVAVPAALAAWAPDAAATLTGMAPPAVTWLPEVVVGGGAAEAAPAVGPAPPAGGLVLVGLLTVAAAAAGGVSLVRLGGGAVRLGRVRRGLPPAPPAVAAALGAACRRAGVDRPVRAVEAPPGTAPFTVGWRRPVVAVPADLGGAALDVALAHEVAHVRRADFAWRAAQRVVVAASAAHPLARVLGRALDLDRERAADAAVLAAWPARRRAYADLLLRYASLPAPPLALGAGRGDSSLKARIDAMNTPLPPDRARRLARAGRLAGLLTLALAAGLAAATAPLPTEEDHFYLVAPAHTVDGRAVGGAAGSMSADPFMFYSLDVVGFGRFVVSETPFEGSTPTARFSGRTLEVEAGGHTLVTRSETPIFEVRPDRRAHARFDAAEGAPRLPANPTVAAESIFGDLSWLGPAGVPRDFGPDRVRERLRGRLPAPPDTTDEVFEVAEEMPRLIGGLGGLQERLEYPRLQREAGVQGTAVVQFVVSREGAVTDPTVIRSSGNDGLDQAALAAVRGARFEPGRQRGEPVRVRFAVPIAFRLDGDAARPAPSPRRPSPEPQRTADGVPIFEVAEVQPTLIGGLAGLQERVVYPPLAREAGIEGQVVVQFVVTKEGGVADAVVLRSPHETLAEAALAAVRGSRFEPGQQRGEPVAVRFAVPITFRLPEGEGGVDEQSQAHPAPDDLRRRLPYSGTDLTLLENADHVRYVHARTLAILDNDAAAAGTATVRYTLLPDGTTTDLEMVENTPDDAVGGMARFLVGMMRFKADRRPPQPYAGATFRLDYQPQR